MASPFSGWVLGGAGLVASPALHAALVEGTLPLETAAVRLVVAVLVVWTGISLLASLVTGTSAASAAPAASDQSHAPVDGLRENG